MKKIVLIFILAAAFIYVKTEETAETETEPKNENSSNEESSEYLEFIYIFRKSFYNSYKKNCLNHTEELEATDRVLEKCINNVVINHTVCESVESYLLNCTSSITKVLNECLPPQSKYLPNLGMKATLSVVNYWCNQKGQTIFEIFNPCIWNPFYLQTRDLQECFNEFNGMMEEYNKESPTPNRVCRDFADRRKCIKLWVTHDCKSVKTLNAVMGFYDALLEPCKEYITSEKVFVPTK